MGGIINLFKNLISGIFGLIGGLFSKKAAGAAPQVSPKAKKSAGFFMELDESPATQAAAAAAPTHTDNSKKADNKAEAKAAKQSIKAKKAAKAELAAPAEVAAPVATVANALNLPQPTVSFADANRLPLATPRRRPGANMGSYLNMAKNMKRV